MRDNIFTLACLAFISYGLRTSSLEDDLQSSTSEDTEKASMSMGTDTASHPFRRAGPRTASTPFQSFAKLLVAFNPTALFAISNPRGKPHWAHFGPPVAKPLSHRTTVAVMDDSRDMATVSFTQQLMSSLPEEEQSGGKGGQTTYDGLLRLDAAWSALRSGQLPKARRIVIEEPDGPSETADFDIVVCGGTIGILIAAALQFRGLSVAVVEAGRLRGRKQDWNASRKEVMELVKLGVLTPEDIAQVIGIEFNPMRVGFPGGDDVWLQDVLNVGVRPTALIEAARRSFESKGGRVFEEAPLQEVTVRPGAAVLTLAGGQAPIRARLVLDAMGQRSPIVAQIRDGQAPDGVCVVVGTCAGGYPEELNAFGDVIFQDKEIIGAGAASCPTQYFWEAFPASSGPNDRTTYLFTYMDVEPQRPSVLDIMEDYWRLLPEYQGVRIEDLQLQRVLYGMFVSYRDSPLPAAYDRILQVGDASGIQSPLSFGGFGAITRHLGRLTNAIGSALDTDAVSKDALSLINPYQPNLRAAWLFQGSMKPPVQSSWSDSFIADVMAATFETQEAAGEDVMKPFLQDVLRVDGLVLTIGGLMVRHPIVTFKILASVGPAPIADWFVHFLAMCIFSALDAGYRKGPIQDVVSKLPARLAYEIERKAEGWQYGAGLDYIKEAASVVPQEAVERAKAGAAAARAAAGRIRDKEPAVANL